jgi:hypothetical protein
VIDGLDASDDPRECHRALGASLVGVSLGWRSAASTASRSGASRRIKNWGHFPNDDAGIKLLWLAIGTIEDKRARDRAKEPASAAAPNAKPKDVSVEGQVTTSWKQASPK